MSAPSVDPIASPVAGVGVVRALEGVRFFAFLAVFTLHRCSSEPESYAQLGAMPARMLAAAISTGGRGVDVFCVLSGFLITRLLRDERVRRGEISAIRFYARRALRLAPLYYATILVTEVVSARLLHRPGLGAQLPWFAAMLGNVSTARWGYPSSAAFPLWSISLEVQAYAIWPWILARASLPALRARLLALVALAFVARAIVLAIAMPNPAMWCLLPTRIDLFAIGGLVALRPAATLARRRASLTFALALSASALIATQAFFPTQALPRPADLIAYALAALVAYLILRIALDPNPPRVLTARPIVGLGRISYGLYALHFAVIGAFRRLAPSLPFALGFALSFAATVGLALCSWRFFERPFLDLKRRFAT